jgi:hypothetical protein
LRRYVWAVKKLPAFIGRELVLHQQYYNRETEELIPDMVYTKSFLSPDDKGGAVQVQPTKRVLKSHASVLLKARCDKSFSNYAFNFNLRRYTEVFLLLKNSFTASSNGRKFIATQRFGTVGRCRLKALYSST